MIRHKFRESSFPLGTIAIAILLLSLPVRAQQQSPPQSAGTPPDGQSQTGDKTKDDKPAASQDTGQGQNTTNNDRLFGVLPNYATVETQQEFGPLSAKGKFKLSAESTFDPYAFAFIGFVALVGQAENSEPSYGQGFAGYAKRYGTSYADAMIGTTMTTAVFPTLLRQDPRYFQLSKGSIVHRTFYAVSRIFVTRTDSGGSQFNSSEIVGNAVAAGLSNTYHPQEDRTFSNTMSVWGTDVMWDTVANVAKEFWPDIRRKIRHEKTDAPH